MHTLDLTRLDDVQCGSITQLLVPTIDDDPPSLEKSNHDDCVLNDDEVFEEWKSRLEELPR